MKYICFCCNESPLTAAMKVCFLLVVTLMSTMASFSSTNLNCLRFTLYGFTRLLFMIFRNLHEISHCSIPVYCLEMKSRVSTLSIMLHLLHVTTGGDDCVTHDIEKFNGWDWTLNICKILPTQISNLIFHLFLTIIWFISWYRFCNRIHRDRHSSAKQTFLISLSQPQILLIDKTSHKS